MLTWQRQPGHFCGFLADTSPECPPAMSPLTAGRPPDLPVGGETELGLPLCHPPPKPPPDETAPAFLPVGATSARNLFQGRASAGERRATHPKHRGQRVVLGRGPLAEAFPRSLCRASAQLGGREHEWGDLPTILCQGRSRRSRDWRSCSVLREGCKPRLGHESRLPCRLSKVLLLGP